jgi:ADP-ribosylglycohydrolase
MADISLQSRFRGSLLGLAAGDALGTTLEFSPPGSFEVLEDIVGGGPFHLKAGEWTDDTSMALCLAESLVECRGFDARDQMQRYLRWRDEGYLSSNGRVFDFGNTVENALNRFRKSGDPYAGSTDPMTAGNGSLMRVAPVALFFHRNASVAVEMAGESSRTTHGAVEAIDACRLYAMLIVLAINGVDKEEILSGTHGLEVAPKIAQVANGSYREKVGPRGMRREPDEIRAAPYVVDTLEAALWSFLVTSNFYDGALVAANLGDDADTVAAIYGQLAGAFYGEAGIPKTWREIVAKKETIVGTADRLLERSA